MFGFIRLFLAHNACLNLAALLGGSRPLANLFGLLHAMPRQR